MPYTEQFVLPENLTDTQAKMLRTLQGLGGKPTLTAPDTVSATLMSGKQPVLVHICLQPVPSGTQGTYRTSLPESPLDQFPYHYIYRAKTWPVLREMLSRFRLGYLHLDDPDFVLPPLEASKKVIKQGLVEFAVAIVIMAIVFLVVYYTGVFNIRR